MIDVSTVFDGVDSKSKKLPKNITENDKELLVNLFSNYPKERPDAISTLEQLLLGP